MRHQQLNELVVHVCLNLTSFSSGLEFCQVLKETRASSGVKARLQEREGIDSFVIAHLRIACTVKVCAEYLHYYSVSHDTFTMASCRPDANI